MGTVKDDMKTDTSKKDKNDAVFGLFKRRNTRKANTQETAKTFADMVNVADDRLQELVAKKEIELKTETGEETYNRKALSLLKTMQYHLDEVINTAADYSDLKH